jgi:alkanesulfonate monooxygenase SsuD/methylene tetrahydromethanopterin reductase-like flavin-dependent oxidoreductase (luciferase family)
MPYPRMEFGYHPPSGDRGFEVIRPREYISDLHHALDIASQSFGSLWVSDHFAYASEFRIECWTHLAWIAARYPGPKLGTIVMSNSFRHPSLMAKMAASLHWMSSGRLILGYGAGWYEKEYRAYGYDYPPPRTRIEMLEEGVQIMKAMWRDAPANFSGKYYRIENAYCEPRSDPPPILMIGGGGERYTMRVAARHADWWNDGLRPVDQLRHKLDVLRQHCEAEGRDFGSIRKTLNVRMFIDRSHSKAIELAGDRLQSDQPPIAGDPVAVREQFAQLAEMGFDLAVLTFPRFQDMEDLKLFVEDVMPHFA